MGPPKSFKSFLPSDKEDCLENLGKNCTVGFGESTLCHLSCSFQCSDKSCLRTPSLKKRVSDANLEGKKDSGMLKYIRLQVLTLGSGTFTEQEQEGGSRYPVCCGLEHTTPIDTVLA